MAVKCKCHGCTDRHDGCHSTCEDYKAYVEAKEAEKNKIKQAKAEHSAYYSYRLDTIRKSAKKSGKALKSY